MFVYVLPRPEPKHVQIQQFILHFVCFHHIHRELFCVYVLNGLGRTVSVRACVFRTWCLHVDIWVVFFFCCFTIFFFFFVSSWMLDGRWDLLPSGSGLRGELLGVPARLLVHKPGVPSPHEHVEVAKHLETRQKVNTCYEGGLACKRKV